jgi:lysozyme family protein
MQNNWDFFYTQVLQSEGTGYEDVPGDNGGPTKCGITIGDVARYNGLKLAYTQNGGLVRGAGDWNKCLALVHGLDPGSAAPIYKRYYWDDIRADELLPGLDYAMADYGTNSGESRPCNVLASLLGKPHTGKVTDDMLAACRSYIGGAAALITHVQDERKAFLEEIAEYPHNVQFRNGWLSRESRVRKQALDLAAAAPPLPPVPVPSPKAVAPEALVSTPGTMKTAGSSKTVWAMGVSFTAPILGHIHAVTQSIANVFSVIYSDFPSIVSDAQETTSAASSLSTLTGGAEIVGGVMTMIGVIALCIAISRHVQLKNQNLKAA